MRAPVRIVLVVLGLGLSLWDVMSLLAWGDEAVALPHSRFVPFLDIGWVVVGLSFLVVAAWPRRRRTDVSA